MRKSLAVLAVALCAVLGLLLLGGRDASASTTASSCVLNAVNVCDVLPTDTAVPVPTTTVLPPINVCAPINSDHTYCDRHGTDGHGCYRWQHWDTVLASCVRNVPITTTVTPPPTVVVVPAPRQVVRQPVGGAETGDGLTAG